MSYGSDYPRPSTTGEELEGEGFGTRIPDPNLNPEGPGPIEVDMGIEAPINQIPVTPGVSAPPTPFATPVDYQRYATPNPTAALRDYSTDMGFGTWDHFMTQEPWLRVLQYGEMAHRLDPVAGNPDGVSDRMRRLLAWGLQNDDEAMNMLNRRGENNWFQAWDLFQSQAVADFIVPGDLNAVTSGEAKAITDAWGDPEIGDALTVVSGTLTPETIDNLRATDRYFADQWTRASSNAVGDEHYVDMDDGERPESVDAYYNSGGELWRENFEMGMLGLDWFALLGAVKGGTAVGMQLGKNIASAGVKAGTAQTAAWTARTAIGIPGRVANTIAKKGTTGIQAYQASRFGKWFKSTQTGPALRSIWRGPDKPLGLLGEGSNFSGRGFAKMNVGAGVGVLGSQLIYDTWIREVPSAQVAEYQRNQQALINNLTVANSNGQIRPHALMGDAMQMVKEQVEEQSSWRNQGNQAATAPEAPVTVPGTATTTTAAETAAAAAGAYGAATGGTTTAGAGAGVTAAPALGTGPTMPNVTEPGGPGLTSTTPMTLEATPPPTVWDTQLTPLTGGLPPTSGPAQLLGGMPDEYQRDASGNLVLDPTTNQPIPNPDPYTKQGPFVQNPIPGLGLSGGYLQGTPQYRDGEQMRIIEAMSPAQIQALTAKMRAAGYEIGAEYLFTGGRINGSMISEFAALLATANWNGTSWEDQLEFEMQAAVKQQQDIMNQNMTSYAKYTYLPPDYDTMAQGARTAMRQQLGRDPTDAEIELYADAFRKVDRQDQRQQYREDKATYRDRLADEMAAQGIVPTHRERIDVPIEDPTTGGIPHGGPTRPMLVDRPDQDGSNRRPGEVVGGEQVDVEASMAEWFERNYGDEIDLRQQMDQAAQNFATMASGSSALTERVRRG